MAVQASPHRSVQKLVDFCSHNLQQGQLQLSAEKEAQLSDIMRTSLTVFVYSALLDGNLPPLCILQL
jgi:hypothetical protein